MKNMKIGTKLIGGFLILAVLAFAAGALTGSEAAVARLNGAGDMTWLILLAAVLLAAVAILLGRSISSSISRPITRVMEAAEKLALGDTGVKLDMVSKDEVGRLAAAFTDIAKAVGALSADTDRIVDAAMEGQLSIRADAEKHQGEYRKIVEGINRTLDGIVGPLAEFSAVLERFSLNDYSVGMNDSGYKGDIRKVATAIKEVHERLLSVQGAYVESANGDFTRLEYFKKVGRRSENDQLMPAVIRLMESVNEAINEANMLSDAIVRGDLELRSDDSKFMGRYRELISGINRIMDAMAAPMHETVDVLDRIADQDYTVEMSGAYQGSFAELANSVNRLIATQNDVLHEINTASGQVAAGTRQISDGSQALSQGVTEQASTIEELTSSIAHVAAQTRQNAASAAQARMLTGEATVNAKNGDGQMKDMLVSMQEINEASNGIFRIIKVIDDIAFQTNILALNAAVEAARAGSYGKGFAVVAEEVRSLAAKSAEAARETSSRIEDSIKKVEHGAMIAGKTADALAAILASTEKAAALVGEIARESEEQASAITQINTGVEQVAAVVQSNSATAEESAAASEELSGQAELFKRYGRPLQAEGHKRCRWHCKQRFAWAGGLRAAAGRLRKVLTIEARSRPAGEKAGIHGRPAFDNICSWW